MKQLLCNAIAACALVVAAGCGGSPRVEPAAETDMSGADAYMAQCAGCHETGLMGAPIVGDKAYWDSRSRLWQSVLVDHATTGYLDMPARGGRPDLSDATIEAAVEYMLAITYPDLPRGD
jgi:cytochrome c5